MTCVDDLHGLVEKAARRWPDKVALVFDEWDLELTFAQVNGLANAFAAAFLARGLQPGDRVATLMGNCPGVVGTWLGAAKIGVEVVPINTRYTASEVNHVLLHSAATLVVGEPRNATMPAIDTDMMDVESVGIPAPSDPMCRQDLPRVVSAQTTMNIQYTSGTTATPKGCVLAHGYWTRIAHEMTRVGDPTSIHHTDRFLTAQPMHYMDPQWHVATALLAGATLVVLDGFHPSTFWHKVRQHEITIFYCLGAMPTLLLKMPPSELDREHQVRAVLCSAIPPTLHRALEDRWGSPWHELYGMTETGVDIRVVADQHDDLVGSSCIGFPAGDREVAVLDVHDRPVRAGEVGQLALRGDWMMSGYHNDPESTRRALRDGWMYTGDSVRIDDAGRVYFVGRDKHIIRRSGENISAAQVEEALLDHMDVVEAACVAVPDVTRGEEILAFIRARDGASLDPATLAAALANRLAPFKIPRFWSFVDWLPRTPSERVQRAKLVARIPVGRSIYDSAEHLWVPNPYLTTEQADAR